MIKYLGIRNFKGWKNTGDLKLAPITVLFGTNSSGKSSIGQFLMMLKQTVESNDRSAGLQLGGGQRSIVDMGTWQDVIFGHNNSNDVSFTLQWTLPKNLEISDPIKGNSVSGTSLSITSTTGLVDSKKHHGSQIRCKGFEYNLLEQEKVTLTVGLRPSGGKFKIDCFGLELIRKTGRVWPLPAPIRFYGFPQEVGVYYQNAQGLEDLSFATEKLFQKIAYLGPLRAYPDRQYIWSGETPPDVGIDGKNWLSAFLSSSARKISPGMGHKKALPSQPFHRLIARWMKEIGLVSDFKAEPVSSGAREYQVKVKVGPNAEWVSIPDVGFGVCQFMPILVECFYAPPGSIIVIEQPELHLHPAVQQNLADLFIEVIKSREDGENRNIQLIIESHSEHFLNRLQRRIAEEKLNREDVSAFFFSQNQSGIQESRPLEVDMFGNITNWPINFFGDSFTDIAERQKAGLALRKKVKQEGGAE